VDDALRELALYPMRVMPATPGMEQLDIGGAVASVSPSQLAPLVHVESPTFDVGAAIAASRRIARDRGKQRVIWWLPPADAWVGAELEDRGIANEDTPGFEALQVALALVEPPAGKVPDDIDVALVETWEQYRDSIAVMVAAFGIPELSEAALRERWDRYQAEVAFSQFACASVGGRVVGMGVAGFSPVGLNLMAGAVLPEARGRGVYRSLVHKRWELAVSRGTPALVMQAGKMSRPVCERLGFRFVDPIRVYVDHQVE
jgi:GNAT superfamily N-acetyltransferase